MESLSKSAKAGYEGFMSSLSEIGDLNMDHLEKLIEKQLAAVQYYTDVSVEQMKAINNIDSFDGFKEFSASSVNTGTKVAKKVVEDGQVVVGLGSSYREGVMSIVKSLSGKAAASN